MGKSGKAWYELDARRLEIAPNDDPKHWEPRFAEVAKLIWKLEIDGIMPARMLFRKTNYVAWLVYRFTMLDTGLDVPLKATIKFVIGDDEDDEFDKTVTETNNTVYLVEPRDLRVTGIDGGIEDNVYETELGGFFISAGESFNIQIEVSETERLDQKKRTYH